jgi:FAD/FMN-containing dehydrogenase
MQQAIPTASRGVDHVIAELRGLLGAQHVVTDAGEREFYSQDVYRAGQLPAAVIRPASSEELAAALKTGRAGGPRRRAARRRHVVHRRLPAAAADSIMVDLLRLNRVLEINAEDCYVTVEAGATWKELCDALEPHGVRTPYFGPLSGLRATIGGALSQGSVFLGSGRYGTAADSVIGLDVLLVDGSLLRLGSHANRNGQPFFRQVGPDTMAMFLSDTGTLGIKTRATFRLVRPQRESRYLSYSFDTAAQLFARWARCRARTWSPSSSRWTRRCRRCG